MNRIKRNNRINVDVTNQEKERFIHQSHQKGLNISSNARMLLNADINIKDIVIPKEKRYDRISILVTSQEKKDFKRKASEQQMNLSNYIRAILMKDGHHG